MKQTSQPPLPKARTASSSALSPGALVCLFFFAAAGHAQTSFTSAIDLALDRNPRVLMAQDDARKALAMLKETKDVYLPSLIANGGAGESYGITLNVPTIFTANAQSLIYSASQRDYIRASRLQLESALLRLDTMKSQVEEDTSIAYLEVDHAQKKLAILEQQYGLAEKLVSTMEDRLSHGIESDLALKRTRREAAEIRLARLEAEDGLAFVRLHLAGLIGVPVDQLDILPETVPSTQSLAPSKLLLAPDLSLLSSQFDAEAKGFRAAGDKRLRWRPSISFAAQYGRISPINGVSSFYNIQGKYNTFFAGVSLQFPVFDAVQRAHSQETAADAAHALHELTSLQNDQTENRLRLHHASLEVEAKADLAEINYEIAQDELASAIAQGNAARNGAPLVTPMDEDRAMLHERQLYLELLDAELEVHKVQISMLRQTGELTHRIHALATTP